MKYTSTTTIFLYERSDTLLLQCTTYYALCIVALKGFNALYDKQADKFIKGTWAVALIFLEF